MIYSLSDTLHYIVEYYITPYVHAVQKFESVYPFSIEDTVSLFIIQVFGWGNKVIYLILLLRYFETVVHDTFPKNIAKILQFIWR